MLYKSEVYNFLINKGFSLVDKLESRSFGDEYSCLSNGNIEFRLITDRSQFYVLIKKATTDDKWYDLALVKAYLLNEKELTQSTPAEDYYLFLKNNYDNVQALFRNDNIIQTTNELTKLEWRRAQQMFPGQV